MGLDSLTRSGPRWRQGAIVVSCTWALVSSLEGHGGPSPESWEPARVVAAAARAGASPAERSDIATLYRAVGYRPVWTDPRGALTARANATLDRLRNATDHGLDPRAYAVGPLAPDAGRPLLALELDVALSVAALRYMRHLHLGRIDPRSVGLALPTWSEPHQFPALLADAITRDRVVEMLGGLSPPFPVYGHLVQALARYRALALQEPPQVPVLPRAVRPGEPYASADALAARLTAFGDGALPVSPSDGLYVEALVEAVRRFQRRHGLTPDGVLGARTIGALRVSAAARARQIEVALERLRWVPDLSDRRLVVVNIPMFRLWAFDGIDRTATPALSMEVIVGRAMRTETPVLVEQLTTVIFRPYWNIPRSILVGEIAPILRRDAGYLARQRMEIVSGPGDDGRVRPPSADALAALLAGDGRLRQRPGLGNALGLVKFVFPNTSSVYMHDTPTQPLFARDRRDFSHGCIRVADPRALAAWVLRETPGWRDDAIEAAMGGRDNQAVAVSDAIDVVLFYVTAAVLPEDGLLHFAEDLYGHDARLERALR